MTYYSLKGLLSLVIFTIIFNQVQGQELEYNQFGSVRNDSIDANFHFDQFKKYVDQNNDSAIYHARRSKILAEAIQDSLLILRSAFALGYLFKEQGNYAVSQEYYLEALRIAEEHESESEYAERLKSIHNNLGLAYYNDGIYEEALGEFLKSILIRRKEYEDGLISLKDAELGQPLTNLGLVYYKLGDLEKAIEYQHQAVIEYKEIDSKNFADNYVNLGLAYSQMASSKAYSSDYSNKLAVDSALHYFRIAINQCEYFEKCKESTLFEAYNGLGLTFQKRNEYDSAIFYLEKASSVNSSIPDQVISIHNRAFVLLTEGKLDESLLLVNKANVLIDSVNLRSIKPENLKLYTLISEKKGDYEDAYRYFKTYDSLNIILFNEKMRSGAKSLEIEYAERDNLNKIKEQDAQIQEQQRSLWLSSIIIVLVSFIGIILYRNNVQRKKANKKLSEANQIIEEQNQQLKNMNVVLEERVRERTKELRTANMALKQSNLELDNFIYKTSHDIRGPLATLQGICNVALMDVQDARAIDYLQKLGKTANRLNEILSKLLVINQINNSEIAREEIDFEMMVDHVIQENRKINAADIAVIKELTPSMTFQSDHNLVKIIISNLVNNAFKYYNPSSRVESFIRIRIDNDRLNLNISVIDNGMGIDEKVGDKIFEIFSKASEMSDSAGLGLYLVKLAVEKLNGKILLKRTREGYTEFKVKIPLN